MDLNSIKEWFQCGSWVDILEKISYLVIFIAAVMVVVGLGIGTVYPGFFVLVAIAGSFLVLLGIVLYILSELLRTLGR